MPSFWQGYLDTLSRRFLDWAADAPCKDRTAELFASSEKQQRVAADKYCVPCPHRLNCLIYSLAHVENYGVWGGTTENERKVLIKKVYSLDARPSKLAKNIELIAKKKVHKINEATQSAEA